MADSVLCDTGEGSGGANMSVIPRRLVGMEDRLQVRSTASLLIAEWQVSSVRIISPIEAGLALEPISPNETKRVH